MKIKKLLFVVVGISLTTFIFNSCNIFDSKKATGNISFYQVPLVCGADETIGCGSRIKPLFIESAKQKEIKESWTNREGTVIAFVWTDGKPEDKVARKLFDKLDIEGSLINDEKEIKALTAGMNGKQIWYQGMAVDSLSLHEAGTIAKTSTQAIIKKGLITQEESNLIRPDIENYFKKELVKVRTFDALINDQKTKWMDDCYQIYANHIGADRAKKVKIYYADYLIKKEQEKANCKENCKDKKDCCTK
jgi:hypothetical protein